MASGPTEPVNLPSPLDELIAKGRALVANLRETTAGLDLFLQLLERERERRHGAR
jgi:hypothetical protein